MAKKPNKTHATAASVDAFIDKQQTVRDDCRALMKLMHELTSEEPYMYGPTIVGYGTYHYKYASGHEGDSCLTGFASRKSDITVYLGSFPGRDPLLAKLGKHKVGGGCLYIKKLGDVDLKVLEKLIVASAADRKKQDVKVR